MAVSHVWPRVRFFCVVIGGLSVCGGGVVKASFVGVAVVLPSVGSFPSLLIRSCVVLSRYSWISWSDVSCFCSPHRAVVIVVFCCCFVGLFPLFVSVVSPVSYLLVSSLLLLFGGVSV